MKHYRMLFTIHLCCERKDSFGQDDLIQADDVASAALKAERSIAAMKREFALGFLGVRQHVNDVQLYAVELHECSEDGKLDPVQFTDTCEWDADDL